MAPFPAFLVQLVTEERGQQFTGRFSGGYYNRVDLPDAADQGVFLVEDDLVVQPLDHLLDRIVINKDSGLLVHAALHPDLDPPAVPVQAGALALVMQEPVARVEMHFLVEPGLHYTGYEEAGYNIISNGVEYIQAIVEG
jgi:hypothetical protein